MPFQLIHVKRMAGGGASRIFSWLDDIRSPIFLWIAFQHSVFCIGRWLLQSSRGRSCVHDCQAQSSLRLPEGVSLCARSESAQSCPVSLGIRSGVYFSSTPFLCRTFNPGSTM